MTPTNESARRQPGADTSKRTAGKNTLPRGIKQIVKRLIITLALWGLLPIPAADSLIRRLHLEAE